MTLEEAKEYFANDKYATKTTGIVIDEVSDNHSVVSLMIKDGHRAAMGQVMGGAIFTLADFAFATATNTPEKFTVTTSSTINYLSQPKDEKLIATCDCIKDGKRNCYCEIKVTDGQNNLVALVITNGTHI